MNIEEALDGMKINKRAYRENWNANNMFVFLVTDWEFLTDVGGVEGYDTTPFICMKTSDGKLVPWLASQSDLLAEDWYLLEETP